MSAPSSPGGGDDHASNSIAEALIRRYTSACLELSSSTSNFASSSETSSNSLFQMHGAESHAKPNATMSGSATSASSSQMEKIFRRKYGSLLDALAAIAPTHAIVLVENLANWEKGVTEDTNTGEPNTNNVREQQKEKLHIKILIY